MRIRRSILILALYASWLVAAKDVPPESLIRENCAKATAILEGMIQSSDTPSGKFTATTIRITMVFRGPFKSGDSLTYYSFKETGGYSRDLLQNGVVVFLVAKPQPPVVKPQTEDKIEWGTATDLSEFEISAALEKRILANLRKKQ
jgi:hypothetical protein